MRVLPPCFQVIAIDLPVVLLNSCEMGKPMPSSKTSVVTVSKRILVSGKVQGVGYRYALADLARGLNIHGWCRNTPDGRVEASVQGEISRVNQLLDWMRQGPPGAVVEQVVVEDQAVLEPLLGENIHTFEIRK